MFGDAVDVLMAWSGLNPAAALLFALIVILLVARLATLPLWLAPVPLDRRLGVLRHPFAARPLRIHLRFRATRFFMAVLLEIWLLVVAWKYLLSLDIAAPAIQLPGVGYGDWLDAVLAQAVVQVAVLLGLVALHWACMRAFAPKSGTLGFVRYHVDRLPIRRFLLLMVLGVILPCLSVFAAISSHPQAPLLGLASVVGLGIVSLLAVPLTLLWERRKDVWLRDALVGRAAPAENMSARELAIRCVAFLQPGELATLAAVAGPAVAPPSTESVDVMPSTDVVEAELTFADQPELEVADFEPSVELASSAASLALERGREYLDAGENRRARRALRDAVASGDPDERADAEQLLKAAGAGVPWRLVFSTSLLVFVGLLSVFAWQWLQLPSIGETRALARSAHVHVRKSGESDNVRLSLLGNRYDYSLNTSLDNVSKHFINAVIASEDRRFRDHGPSYIVAKFIQAGLFCVARKLNVFSSATGCAGNSTISQQLARNLFLSEPRSITRKLKELLWAIKMELGFSKDEILKFYLNRLYLGRGNFGVELGARDYFAKSSSQLSLYEAVLLAAAIKRPGWNWNQDRKGALKRATLIVALMRRHGYAPEGAKFPSNFRPKMGNRRVTKPYLGHLWQWIQPDVAHALEDLPNGDYKVLTSLNAELEVYAEWHLEAEIKRLRRAGVNATQGAAVLMRPSGEVLAMVGGVGGNVRGRGFNRAKRTTGLLPRPPASAFKPFVYLAALEMGLTPQSRINARPVSIKVKGDPKPYQPQNYDGKVRDFISMREGLVKSVNTAAVRLLHDEVGFERLFSTLTRLGIQTDGIRKQWGLALGSQGVSLIEMASAYAVFANGGRSVQASGFNAITTADGRVVWRAPRARRSREFKQRHIQQLDSMLRDVVSNGTGQRAAYKIPASNVVAGKTGTGDSFVDAWFIGYTEELVIGVWIGNDRPRSMRGVFGGTAPARAFNAMLRDIINHTDVLGSQK